MLITRRQFLISVAGGFLLYIFGVRGEEDPQEVDISSLNVYLPRWLFGDSLQAEDKKEIKALNIFKDQNSKNIVVRFSEGKKLELPPEMSAGRLLKENKAKASRNSMLLKRVLSFTLNSIYEDLMRSGKLHADSFIKDQLEKFQAEEVIDQVTIKAILDLLIDLEKSQRVKNIRWESASGRFVVS